MATLVQRSTGASVRLSSPTLVGRDPEAALPLDDARSSWHHARLHWQPEGWEVRDLASTNGTLVDGARVEPGQNIPLVLGTVLCFGCAENVWELVDVSPPGARAVSPVAGVRYEEDGILVLPNDERPRAFIFRGSHGEWMCEQGAEVETLRPGQDLTFDGASWHLDLPRLVTRTRSTTSEHPALASVDLELTVSPDAEFVKLRVCDAGEVLLCYSAVPNYLLLELARQRQEDAELPEGERGWVYREELCRRLRIDQHVLNVHIYRLRKQLGSVGIENAVDVVERRQMTSQLRLGSGRVRILGTTSA